MQATIMLVALDRNEVALAWQSSTASHNGSHFLVGFKRLLPILFVIIADA